MLTRLRTYRLAPALLALTLVLTGAGPLVEHLCAEAAGHMTMRDTVHAICTDCCPARPDTPADEPPADSAACCTAAPAAPTEEAAVTAPTAPRTDGVLYAIAVVAWADVRDPVVPPVSPVLTDTGPPPLPVRSHLAHSVLLI